MTLADKIRPHVAQIMREAIEGCPRAQEVIRLYQMHVRSPSDPAAPALCECAFDDWRKAKSAASEATT